MEASKYKIRAAEMDGRVKEISIQAASEEEAANIARAKNQIPIKVNLDTSKIDLNMKIEKKKKVKVSDLSVFCRQLSAMVGAGMPINRALDIQEKQTDNPTLREALQHVSTSIKQGEPLSKAMRAFPDVFPQILLSMIESGEATGKLDEVLERMSGHYIKENKINNRVKGAMIYPIVLIVATVVVMAVLMIFVIPTFVEIFENSGEELPGITQFVLAISYSMQSYWFIYFFVIAAVVIGYKHYATTEKGRYQIDEFKLKMPILSGPMRQIVTARFTRTMATLLQSGISIVNAMGIAAETTNNVIVFDSIAMASEGIKKGNPLTHELKKTGLFPLMMTSMVSIGEETGSIDTLLEQTADYYDEEMDAAISRLLGLLEPVMILIMGVGVGTIVIAMMFPMLMMSSGTGVV